MRRLLIAFVLVAGPLAFGLPAITPAEAHHVSRNRTRVP